MPYSSNKKPPFSKTMTYDEDTAWTVWPEYFDKGRSRSEGRRVNRRLAIHEPTLASLEQAVKMLGLEYRVEPNKLYPRNWYSSQGRIRVERALSKTELLNRIAKIMISQRS
jgi:signal recognition particle subunit SRP19